MKHFIRAFLIAFTFILAGKSNAFDVIENNMTGGNFTQTISSAEQTLELGAGYNHSADSAIMKLYLNESEPLETVVEFGYKNGSLVSNVISTTASYGHASVSEIEILSSSSNGTNFQDTTQLTLTVQFVETDPGFGYGPTRQTITATIEQLGGQIVTSFNNTQETTAESFDFELQTADTQEDLTAFVERTEGEIIRVYALPLDSPDSYEFTWSVSAGTIIQSGFDQDHYADVQLPLLTEADQIEITATGQFFQLTETQTGRIYLTSTSPIDTAQITDDIGAFQSTRANQLLSNQADIACRFDGSCQGQMAVNVANGQADIDFRADSQTGAWAELTASFTTQGEVDSDYSLLTLGYDRKFANSLLLGAMLELDYSKSQLNGRAIDGKGYLVGPYFVYHSQSSNLKMDGRALFGSSSNTYSIEGGESADFGTQRKLATLGIESELEMGNLTLRPRVETRYTDDALSAFDFIEGDASTAIGENTVSIWQNEASLNVSKDLNMEAGSMSVFGSASVIHSKTTADGSADGLAPEYDGYRGKIEFGFDRKVNENFSFNAKLGYDGLGQNDYSSTSLGVGLQLGF